MRALPTRFCERGWSVSSTYGMICACRRSSRHRGLVFRGLLEQERVVAGPITEAGVADAYFKAPWARDEASSL